MKVGRLVVAVVVGVVVCTALVSAASRWYGRRQCREVKGMLLDSYSVPMWVDPRTGRRTEFLPPREESWAQSEIMTFLRPYHHRGRNVVLCLVESMASDEGNWLLEYSLRGRLLSRRKLPDLSSQQLAISPDEEWVAFERVDAGPAYRVWVGRLEDPFDGWEIEVPRLPWGELLWAGEYLYYTVKDGDGARRVVRVHWRGGEPEDLGWRGRLITTGGHDPQRILWVKEDERSGDAVVMEWRRDTDPGRCREVWRALSVADAAMEYPGGKYLVRAQRRLLGLVDWRPLMLLVPLQSPEAKKLFLLDPDQGRALALPVPARFGDIEYVPEEYLVRAGLRGRSSRSGNDGDEAGK